MDRQNGLIAATKETTNLVTAVDAPVLGTPDQVETASTVNGVFLRVEVIATSSAGLPNFYMIVWKNPGGNLSEMTPNTVGSDDNKRFVIHQEMVMLQAQSGSNPRTAFVGVIRIPRSYRRMGINDKLNLTVLAPGVNISYCVQCIYKEIR